MKRACAIFNLGPVISTVDSNWGTLTEHSNKRTQQHTHTHIYSTQSTVKKCAQSTERSSSHARKQNTVTQTHTPAPCFQSLPPTPRGQPTAHVLCLVQLEVHTLVQRANCAKRATNVATLRSSSENIVVRNTKWQILQILQILQMF